MFPIADLKFACSNCKFGANNVEVPSLSRGESKACNLLPTLNPISISLKLNKFDKPNP